MGRNRIINLSNLEQFTAVNLLSDPGAVGGPVQVPSCMQVVVTWGLEDGKIGHNVLYGRTSGTPAPTVAMANAILSGLTSGSAWTGLASVLASTTTLGGITLRNVDTPNNALVASNNPGQPGTATGEALPNEVALVATLRTAKAGRAFRGRMYVPGFGVGSLFAGNVASAGTVTALQTWVNTITGVLSGQGMTWVLGLRARQAYTGETGTAHPARAATSEAITSAQVRDNHWDSQRRRGLK